MNSVALHSVIGSMHLANVFVLLAVAHTTMKIVDDFGQLLVNRRVFARCVTLCKFNLESDVKTR